jgi:hypothetical protein
MFPNIEGILAFFSDSVILFDGIILPILMKIKMMEINRQSRLGISLNYMLALLLFILMIVTTYIDGKALIEDIFNKKEK